MARSTLWGFNLADYCERFALTTSDFQGSILEYGCGVSAVNSELRNIAQEVISCDPWFQFDSATLSAIARASFEARILELGPMAETLEACSLIQQRRSGMDTFFADYQSDFAHKRYIADMKLEFSAFRFDLALSHQFFFSNGNLATLDNYLESLFALTKVAKEVRLFPLHDASGKPAQLLGPVLLALQQANYGVEIRTVKANFQAQGNAVLRVVANWCEVT